MDHHGICRKLLVHRCGGPGACFRVLMGAEPGERACKARIRFCDAALAQTIGGERRGIAVAALRDFFARSLCPGTEGLDAPTSVRPLCGPRLRDDLLASLLRDERVAGP